MTVPNSTTASQVPTPGAAPAQEPQAQPEGDSPALLSDAVAPAPGAGSDTPKSQTDTAPGEVKPDAPPAPEGAPEAYTDFNYGTLPEGMQVNQPMMEEFKTVSKDLGLTQDKAQKLVDLTMKHAALQYQQMEKGYQEQRRAWADETIKELGPKHQEELAFAAAARDRLGSPELTALLKETGLENHKLIIKHFIKIGKAISEDTLVGGRPSSTSGLTAEERFEKQIASETVVAGR